MSQDHNHLNHATWECKYHVVFTPKYRKKLLFGQIRRHLGTVFHELARGKECKIEEGHLMLDLDCAERGTQATQFPGPQILGEGILCFDRRAGRGDDPRLHQKAGDGGQAIGSIATEARHLMTSQLSSQNPL